MPRVRRVRQCEGPVRGAQREELLQLSTGLRWIANHQRFALPNEPQLAVTIWLVKFAVDFGRRFSSLGIDHERDLRSASAGFPSRTENLAEVCVNFRIRARVG